MESALNWHYNNNIDFAQHNPPTIKTDFLLIMDYDIPEGNYAFLVGAFLSILWKSRVY